MPSPPEMDLTSLGRPRVQWLCHLEVRPWTSRPRATLRRRRLARQQCKNARGQGCGICDLLTSTPPPKRGTYILYRHRAARRQSSDWLLLPPPTGGLDAYTSICSRMRCDFCGSLRPRWSYPIEGGSRRACDDCRQAIEADDREELLKRSLLIAVPLTVSDRYAPRFREQAKRLHAEFWEQRDGPARAL